MGGVYYRKTLGTSSKTRSRGRATRPAARVPAAPLQPVAGDVILHEVTGAKVLELTDASRSELTQQINDAASTASLMPLVILCYLLVITIPLGLWLRTKDAERRSVVIFYDVSDEHLKSFEALTDAFAALTGCQGKWSVTAEGSIDTLQQRKANAGASSVLRRTAATFDTAGPRVVTTNIAVPSLYHANTTLYFLPDRALVQQGKRYADLSYSELQLRAGPIRFIEANRPVSDATQVGTTWKYVNKDGGPDKRFKDNRQLPVMQYGELEASSGSGLHLLWEVSRPESAAGVVRAAADMQAVAGR
jgi:DNA polymerase-3 subunit epsilon